MIGYPAVYRVLYRVQRLPAILILGQVLQVLVIIPLRRKVGIQPFVEFFQTGVKGQSCGNETVIALHALTLTLGALEGV